MVFQKNEYDSIVREARQKVGAQLEVVNKLRAMKGGMEIGEASKLVNEWTSQVDKLIKPEELAKHLESSFKLFQDRAAKKSPEAPDQAPNQGPKRP